MWSNRQKMHDADAERARQNLPEPTGLWRVPGAHVAAMGASFGDRVGGAVQLAPCDVPSGFVRGATSSPVRRMRPLPWTSSEAELSSVNPRLLQGRGRGCYFITEQPEEIFDLDLPWFMKYPSQCLEFFYFRWTVFS